MGWGGSETVECSSDTVPGLLALIPHCCLDFKDIIIKKKAAIFFAPPLHSRPFFCTNKIGSGSSPWAKPPADMTSLRCEQQPAN